MLANHLRSLALGIALSIVAISMAADPVPRIGVLWPGDVDPWMKAFLEGLRQNGYVDGKTAAIDIRDTGSDFDSGSKLAEQLISQRPDVIYVSPGILAKHVLEALARAGRDIPVVIFTWDPVGEGLVDSASHPGRNVTAIGTAHDPQFMSKQLQLLKETIPRLGRVVYMFETNWDLGKFFGPKASVALDTAGRQLRLSVSAIEVQDAHRIDSAFAQAIRMHADAIIVPVSPLVTSNLNRKRIIELAAKHHLPAVYGDELFTYDGGLMSYWTSVSDGERRAGELVARILRGAKAGDIPVDYPTRFRLVINSRTAKALRLSIPESVLLQADEVIK
jgi:putative ABC transport system substrate-binding protein